MARFKRLVAQVHDIEADTPAQADEIARIRADAVQRIFHNIMFVGVTAWAVSVADGVSGADELWEILTDTYVFDEVDDNPERNPHPGYLPIDRTMIPERLMAWRDAAVKAALESR